jgi:SAM-dependent methyltransferase
MVAAPCRACSGFVRHDLILERAVTQTLVSVWCCPSCRGELACSPDSLACLACGQSFSVVDGVPDLRVDRPDWVEEDRERARRLVHDGRDKSVADLIRGVFAARGWDPNRVETFTRRTLERPIVADRELDGWLSSCAARSRTFLDVGCGPGGLLVAAARRNVQGYGIDATMLWAVIAKRAVAEAGGVPVVAGAFAEHLPLDNGTVGASALLDVIEHVGDPAQVLREVDRVTVPGGRIAVSTPNRFSLGAESHVGVWGVGWLPRQHQARYVQRRTGDSYSGTEPRSVREIRRLVRQHTSFAIEFSVPQIPRENIERFPRRRRMLGRVYNRVTQLRMVRPALLAVGPLFHATGQKRLS